MKTSLDRNTTNDTHFGTSQCLELRQVGLASKVNEERRMRKKIGWI